jgi:hypothetical protein
LAQQSPVVGGVIGRVGASTRYVRGFFQGPAVKRDWRLTDTWIALCLVLLVLSVVPLAGAADLKGRAINETLGKPAAGDVVVLLSLSEQGMTEAAHTRTDASGRFALPIDAPNATHVVRIVHQGVTYHQVVEPGTRPVAVAVYDVADRVDGVTAVMDVERFEATDDALEVKQLITVRNDSSPPRTLMNDHPFEIQLPLDAQVQSGLVQVEDGPPLKQKPVAGDRKGQYYFMFPVRPGDTRFAIVYRVPYKGEALIEPQLRNPLEKFVVMLPRSMKFEPKDEGVFHSMPDTTPDNVQGTGPVSAEQQILAFHISGTGTLEELQGRRQEAEHGKTTPANVPGGGLGPPIEAPDPLQPYRWQILAGLAVLGAAGLVYVTRKTKVSRSGSNPVFTQNVRREQANQQYRNRLNRRRRQRVRV